MDQTLRLQALSGGPFTATNNRLDFDIPDDAVWDLSQSWVNIYLDATTTETAGKTGVHKLILERLTAGAANDPRSWFNVSMVRNASMTAARAGRLEDIRDVNCLRQTLKDYMHSTSEKDGLRYKSMRQPADRTTYMNGPLNELHREGTVASRNIRAAIPIPLSDLFELGMLEEYHANKWGKTRVHLEVDIDRIGVREAGTERQAAVQSAFDDVTTVGDVTSLTTTATYPRLEDSPFWVSQKVVAAATGGAGGGAITTSDVVITSITRNTNGTLTIVLDAAIATLGAGQTLTGVTLRAVAANTVTIAIPQAEIVLQRVRNPGPAPDRLDYRTFTTEQYTGNNETTFQRIFQCEPNCVNLFLTFPQNALSRNTNLTSYRIRNNNKDLTDRDVNINYVANQNRQKDPLHYDRLSMAFANADLPLKNYSQANLDTADTARNLNQQTDNINDNVTLIATPLPLTPRDKNVQINLEADAGLESFAGISRMNLYKQVLRSIS